MLIWLLPLISAFIGWFTNWIAIKMLFHPREPKRILGITFQGIFPKRQAQFAQKLGALVSTELINFNDIQQKLVSPSTLNQVSTLLDEKLSNFLENKLGEHMPMLSMFISKSTIDTIKDSIKHELTASLPEIMTKLTITMKQDLNVEQMVTEKVQNFSSDKLEQILNDIMKTEFRFVEIIGGVLGFIIGLVQVIITKLAAV
jgi:uncharacterized membrane protein YheB (UPF0754 family)